MVLFVCWQNKVNWRNIAIALKASEKGKEKAHACANAWLQQLTSGWPINRARKSGTMVAERGDLCLTRKARTVLAAITVPN
jgi:hypothetical protein